MGQYECEADTGNFMTLMMTAEIPGEAVALHITPVCAPYHQSLVEPSCIELNSVSASQVTLISSKSRVYLLKDRDPVGLPDTWSAGF